MSCTPFCKQKPPRRTLTDKPAVVEKGKDALFRMKKARGIYRFSLQHKPATLSTPFRNSIFTLSQPLPCLFLAHFVPNGLLLPFLRELLTLGIDVAFFHFLRGACAGQQAGGIANFNDFKLRCSVGFVFHAPLKDLTPQMYDNYGK